LVVTVKKLPGNAECIGRVVQASENSSPEALLMLKLRTTAGQKVISEFNRTRDLLVVEERAAASATLQ
jgi:hypothetical protein